MCQPSASSAIEWNIQPVVISTTIITAVSTTTPSRISFSQHVRAVEMMGVCQEEISVVCIANTDSHRHVSWIRTDLFRALAQRLPLQDSRPNEKG